MVRPARGASPSRHQDHAWEIPHLGAGALASSPLSVWSVRRSRSCTWFIAFVVAWMAIPNNSPHAYVGLARTVAFTPSGEILQRHTLSFGLAPAALRAGLPDCGA